MQSQYKAILISLLLTLMLNSCDTKERTSNSISIGDIATIHSQVLNERRTVWVHVPEEYNASDSVKYPVAYIMDGDDHFTSVVGLMQQMSAGNSICPKMIIVGIINTDRTRDLTPTYVNSNRKDSTSLKVSGGGENFTNFISDELIPFIEKNYPATKERTLVGHSLGGLMVINTLIKHGHLFDKYVAIDPSLWWDNWKSLKEYEQALNENDFKKKSLS